MTLLEKKLATHAFNVSLCKFRLEQNCFETRRPTSLKSPLEQSNHTLLSVLHYTNLLSELISYTAEYRVIIAINLKE
jgi:hypothetical protein